MSCMCGDTRCGSCGPAQGNLQCPVCNRWADGWGEVPESEQTGDWKARCNAVTLAQNFQDIVPDCECDLCWEAMEMLPCANPEECGRVCGQLSEQEDSEESEELWRDQILERQELEDFEGPQDYGRDEDW